MQLDKTKDQNIFDKKRKKAVSIEIHIRNMHFYCVCRNKLCRFYNSLPCVILVETIVTCLHMLMSEKMNYC